MEGYVKAAIRKLYGYDDDFLILGLTGRTGSGCSTAAKILTSDIEKIKNSLFNGDQPDTNEKRKQKILYRYYEKNWEKFILIKVRSILALFLAEEADEKISKYLGKFTENATVKEELLTLITDIRLKSNVFHVDQKDISYEMCIGYYITFLQNATDEITCKLGPEKATELFIEIGQNVRKSGNAMNENKTNGKFYSLSDRINKIIKLIRKCNPQKRTFIVIDAIRNPLEAIYFQERYAAFHLIAISCPDEERKTRLRKVGLSEQMIKKLDTHEYSNVSIENEASFSIQDIKACIQRADLYINNQDDAYAVSEYNHLANQIIRFVMLLKHPGLITPTAEERCMQIAYAAKLNSGCISRQVGAVITNKDFSIISIGWNDAPYGQVPCNLRNRFDLENGSDLNAYSEFEKTNKTYIDYMKTKSIRYSGTLNSGRNISYCFKSEYNEMINKGKKRTINEIHTRSIHAEENAFLQISKYGGIGVEDGYLFTTASPCVLCAKKAYQLGIKRIYYIEPYPGISVPQILKGGSKNPEMVLFSGAIGYAFQQLFTPIIPMKDELNIEMRKRSRKIGEGKNQ